MSILASVSPNAWSWTCPHVVYRVSLGAGLHEGDKGKAMDAKFFPDFLYGRSIKIMEDGKRGRGRAYKNSLCPRFLCF